MIHWIILAAVRKGYNPPHMLSLLARQLLYVYRRDVMMQCHARISHENLPITQIRKHYYKLTVVNRLFEHRVVMYLLKYWFQIIFNPKKLRTAALNTILFTTCFPNHRPLKYNIKSPPHRVFNGMRTTGTNEMHIHGHAQLQACILLSYQ